MKASLFSGYPNQTWNPGYVTTLLPKTISNFENPINKILQLFYYVGLYVIFGLITWPELQ